MGVLRRMLACWIASNAVAFSGPGLQARQRPIPTSMRHNIEYQSDWGRGQQHLSASVSEGNIVVFQGGTWFVDSVQVGDGTDPYFCYALIETIQLVWTHNCEHGVLRGLQVDIDDAGNVKLIQPVATIEFGPEQLIAKIPVEWDEASETGKLLVSVCDDAWLPME